MDHSLALNICSERILSLENIKKGVTGFFALLPPFGSLTCGQLTNISLSAQQGPPHPLSLTALFPVPVLSLFLLLFSFCCFSFAVSPFAVSPFAVSPFAVAPFCCCSFCCCSSAVALFLPVAPSAVAYAGPAASFILNGPPCCRLHALLEPAHCIGGLASFFFC